MKLKDRDVIIKMCSIYAPVLSYNLLQKVERSVNSLTLIRRRLVAKATTVYRKPLLSCLRDQPARCYCNGSRSVFVEYTDSAEAFPRPAGGGLDFNHTKDIEFCEMCIRSKQTKSVFLTINSRILFIVMSVGR